MLFHSECNDVMTYNAPMTRQQAIDAMCKGCIYDPLDDGTWRMQVQQCEITDCPLWNYRPKSRSKMPNIVDSVPVQPHYDTNNNYVMQEEPHGKHIEY